MQNKTRLELADYEAENLARLQKMFSRKWEFIFMQAEAQSKVDKKRDKLERKVLDSQERAFWDVHRPMVIIFSNIGERRKNFNSLNIVFAFCKLHFSPDVWIPRSQISKKHVEVTNLLSIQVNTCNLESRVAGYHRPWNRARSHR